MHQSESFAISATLGLRIVGTLTFLSAVPDNWNCWDKMLYQILIKAHPPSPLNFPSLDYIQQIGLLSVTV